MQKEEKRLKYVQDKMISLDNTPLGWFLTVTFSIIYSREHLVVIVEMNCCIVYPCGYIEVMQKQW